MKITQASYPLAKRSSAISSHTSHYFLRPLTGRNLAPGNKERKKERKKGRIFKEVSYVSVKKIFAIKRTSLFPMFY